MSAHSPQTYTASVFVSSAVLISTGSYRRTLRGFSYPSGLKKKEKEETFIRKCNNPYRNILIKNKKRQFSVVIVVYLYNSLIIVCVTQK